MKVYLAQSTFALGVNWSSGITWFVIAVAAIVTALTISTRSGRRVRRKRDDEGAENEL